MRKFNIILKSFLFAGFLLLMIGCATEDLDQQNVNQSSTEAKIWFDANKNNYSATILEYAKNFEWQNAIISDGDLGQVIEVPFTLKANLSISNKNANLYNDNHRLMFIKGENKEFKLFYVQIFTTDEKSKTLDKNYNYYNIQDDFDGKVFVQELSTNIVSKLDFEKGNKIKPSLTSKEREAEVTCVAIGYWYEDGHFEPIDVLYCEGGGGGSGEQPGSGGYGGGGGTSGSNPSNPSTPKAVKNQAQFISLIGSTDVNAFNITSVQDKNTIVSKAEIALLPWVSLKLDVTQTKVGDKYVIDSVVSKATGMTIGYAWEQTSYGQTTNGNITTLIFNGVASYTAFVQGIGEFYSSSVSYSININNTTGKIISGRRLPQ